ncbi:MAG: hypothetical protein M1812_002321 [Candelaria pacifica]|nr:MAG: hypothetical protein M1812_002321 [Candelaria pacifica]
MARRWLAIWKECTYRRGLARKGSERRRRYAEDMKKLVQASKRRTAEAEIDEYCDSRREQLQPSPPLKKPRVDEGASQHHQRGHQSRRSLPSEIGRPSQSINNTLPGTGQRDQNPKASNGIPFDGPTKTSRSHQRSRTHIDPSTLTRSKRTPQKISPSASTSLGSSFLSGKSTLSSSVLSKAHGLVPNGRIDTTRTPYFRMKAMGLTPSGFSKPETPTARRGTKRSRDHEDEGLGTSKSAKVTPPDRGSKMHVLDGGRDSRQRERLETGYPETPSTEGGKVNDEDEELFAQMRQVKEAMAESIQLCQQERARSEFSRSVSGGSGNGSKPQVKSDEGLQSFGSRHGCSREVWRDPPVGGAKATFEKQEEEEMEEVDGDADEVDNGGIEDDEEDEGEEEDEDRKEDEDEEELEFEDDEEVEDYEGQEIFEGENDSEFNENYSDSEEEEDDDNDSASTGESEDLADLTTTTTTTNSPSSNFLTGIISNNIRKPVVNQSTSSSAAGKGNTIEDAIEL